MPMFDFKCPVCEVMEEVYVPSLNTAVFCDDCYGGYCVMDRQSFSSGSRATFDINTGYNANNGYGLRWPNNPSDLKLNPYI